MIMNAGRFAVGTQFVGNVNGAMMEVVGFKCRYHSSGHVAVIKDLKTGKTFTCGLDALERCDVTIVKAAR